MRAGAVGVDAAADVQSGELGLVLLLIADESRHGYDLIRAIEELPAANMPGPGVIYPR
jgi:DNA-binding PadR family transcriptional regulator